MIIAAVSFVIPELKLLLTEAKKMMYSGVLHFKYVFIIKRVRGTGVSVVSIVTRLQAG